MKGVLTGKKLTPMMWFIILTVIAVGLALGLPPELQAKNQLHINNTQYREAITVLLVPYVIIWYAAFYSFDKLKDYAKAIKGSEDGVAFRKIMIGFGFFAFGLIVPTIISFIFQIVINKHAGFMSTSVIIVNYLSLLTLLVTFWIVSGGTRYLTNVSKSRAGLTGSRIFAAVFIGISVLFTYLVIKYHSSHPNTYYLNTAVLIITFVVPYLFGWYLALLSAFEFRMYARNTKGLLYKRSLPLLSRGIAVVVLGDIAIQFLENTFVAGEVRESLSKLLVFEYILLVIIGLGLALIALGTKKLKRIEEV